MLSLSSFISILAFALFMQNQLYFVSGMFLSTCFLAFWIWQDFIFLAFWVQQDSFFLAFWIRQVSGFLNALITCYNHSLTVASGPFRTVFGVWFPGVVSAFVSGDSGASSLLLLLT